MDILKLIYGDKEAKPPRLPAKRNSFRDPDPSGELKSFLLLDPNELIPSVNVLLAEVARWKTAWRDQHDATGNAYWNGFNNYANTTREFLTSLLMAFGEMSRVPGQDGVLSMTSGTREKLYAAGLELLKRGHIMSPPADKDQLEEWRGIW